MDVNLKDFIDVMFPQYKKIVYILYFKDKNTNIEIPFYIGESSRGIGRFYDYLMAQFAASTDFKVGEAIRHFQGQGNPRVRSLHLTSAYIEAGEGISLRLFIFVVVVFM